MRVTAMRVTAYLADEVIYSGDLIHLDGILASGVYRGLSRREQLALPDLRAPWAVDVPLPLATWSCSPVGNFDNRLLDDDGNLWGWCASIELSGWDGHGLADIRKRPPVGEMIRYANAKSVNIGSSALKAYDIGMPTVRARTQSWYCEGDIDAVRKAIARVPAIGRKRNVGYGTVMRWDASETEQSDYQRVRPVSAGEFPNTTVQSGRIRPPYHHRSRTVSECNTPSVIFSPAKK